jgi:predicted flap endonuclease-1-like 5' DNA nuclease
MFRILFFILGILIGSWLLRPIQREERPAAPPAPAKPTAPAAPPKPAAAPTAPAFKAAPSIATSAQPDALIDIKGIGLVALERLNELGIVTFAQLAAETPESLAEKMGGRTTAERIAREDWIGQAKARL